MSKELEALEQIKDLFIQNEYGESRGKTYDFGIECYEIIKKALTPPTVDEVCVELKDFFKNSKYHNYIDTVYYSERGKYFYTEDEQRNLIEMIFDNYYVHEIPPRLISMIGKFYESLVGEKWTK